MKRAGPSPRRKRRIATTAAAASGGPFAGLRFALSAHEPGRAALARCVRQHGGLVVVVDGPTAASARRSPPDYFVQSYNCEFDDSFEEAADAGNTVPAAYVVDCAAAGRLLDVRLHALGEGDVYGEDSATVAGLAALLPTWPRPLADQLERQCQPQCYADFAAFPDRLRRGEAPPVVRLVRIRQQQQQPASCITDAEADLAEFLAASTGCRVVSPSAAASSVLHWRQVGPSLARLRVGRFDYDVGLRGRRGGGGGGGVQLEATDLIAALADSAFSPSAESALVALVDCGLFERGIPEPLYGRGTGDRCCVVSTIDSGSGGPPAHLLGTALHELLHCFGLDHCPYLSCVLNAYTDAGLAAHGAEAALPALLLCPIDLRKLLALFPPAPSSGGGHLAPYFRRLAGLLRRLRLPVNCRLAEAAAALQAAGGDVA